MHGYIYKTTNNKLKICSAKSAKMFLILANRVNHSSPYKIISNSIWIFEISSAVDKFGSH